MKILATGGTGYIGSHTVVELLNAGHDVEILDNLFNSKLEVLDKIKELTGKSPKFYQVDLTDYDALEKVFEDTHFDAVFHFAGLKAVGESVSEPLKYYYNNVTGTVNLLRAMKKNDCNKIVFSSSATVYGIPTRFNVVTKTFEPLSALDESLPTGQNITNPYGKTKYMIEEILKDEVFARPEFSASILRYFNPIGNHESGLLGEDPNGIPNNLMPIVMRVSRNMTWKKEHKNEPLPPEIENFNELAIFGNDYNTPDGSCIRDYIHVVDLAKGHLKALNHLNPGQVDIYNLGTGKGTSVFEIVKIFEKVSGKKLPTVIAPRRAGDLPEMFAVPSRAEAELGWKADLTVEDAMRDTLKFLNNGK